MAFIPTPNGAKGVVVFTHGTQRWSNSIWAVKSNFYPDDLGDFALALDDWAGAYVLPYLSTGALYIGSYAYDMRSISGLVIFENTNAGAGTNDAAIVPINNCGVVTWRTGSRGRSARGRMYLAGFTEGEITGGVLTTTFMLQLDNVAENLLSKIQDKGWSPSIVSFQENGVVREEGYPRSIQSWEIRSNIVGSQRRRLDRP